MSRVIHFEQLGVRNSCEIKKAELSLHHFKQGVAQRNFRSWELRRYLEKLSEYFQTKGL